MKTRRIISIIIILSSVVLFSQCTKKIVDTTGSINGIVTSVETGEPIANVNINLSPSGKTISTGTDGAYEFVNLDPKQYKIQAMHKDYKTDTKTVTVISGEVVRGDMRLTHN